MKRPPHRLRHASVGSLLAAAFRVAFCFAAVVLCICRASRGVLTGEVELPVRALSVTVTTTDPDWFTIALLALMVAAVFFGFLTILFARQLVKTYQS